MQRSPEITLVTKFGSKSIGTPDGEPRAALIASNAAELAHFRQSGLVVIVSSGAELFGAKRVLTPEHREHLKKRKDQIREKWGNDEDELERRIRNLNIAVSRDIHRVGQARLMEVWGNAFAEHGITVIPELLDGQVRDLSEDIGIARRRESAILVFNGHGSLEPEGDAQDNDQNLPGVVDWVAPHMDEDPNDPETRLHVLGVTDPGTRGLLNRKGNTIRVYRGMDIVEHIDPKRAISKGGPTSKALAFQAIKEAHPGSRVGISGNRPGIVKIFLSKGKADTLVELRRK